MWNFYNLLSNAGILIILFLISLLSLSAQGSEDVVYLKNGSVIRGNIIELIPGESLKIQTTDGRIYYFKMSEIQKITNERELGRSPDLTPNITYIDQPEKVTPLKNTEFLFNPLGVFQFGPIIEFNFKIGDSFYIGPHFRYSSLGFLYQEMVDLYRDNMSCAAIGSSFKNFYGKGQDKFYLGGIVEYGWGNGEDYAYGLGDIKVEYTYLTAAVNPGYRLRYRSGFFLNFGGVFGIAKETYNNYYNEDMFFFIMLDLSLGWEF